MKPTNQELCEALEACAQAIEDSEHINSDHGLELMFDRQECICLIDAAEAARALLDGKSCEDCEFGDSNDVNLLCIWKRSHGPVWDRNCIPCALSRDYADECPEYKEKHK